MTKEEFTAVVSFETFYWIGFDDGFAGQVCRDTEMDSKAAFAYRNGFAAGSKAAEQA